MRSINSGCRNPRHYLYRIVNRRADLTLDLDRAWRVPRSLDDAAMHDAAMGQG